jgi:Na+/melibiose symporter-like transporter
VNLVVVVTLLPETHPIEARIPLPRRRELQPFTQLARVFANPRVRRLCAAFFLFMLAFNTFTAILVLYFKQTFGWWGWWPRWCRAG